MKKLDNRDCGRRVLPRLPTLLSYNGRGHFKTYVDGMMQPYRHCELSEEGGGNEIVVWEPIYQAVAPGAGRPWQALTRRLFYGAKVGKSFSLRSGYNDRSENKLTRGTVVLSFRRLS